MKTYTNKSILLRSMQLLITVITLGTGIPASASTSIPASASTSAQNFAREFRRTYGSSNPYAHHFHQQGKSPYAPQPRARQISSAICAIPTQGEKNFFSTGLKFIGKTARAITRLADKVNWLDPSNIAKGLIEQCIPNSIQGIIDIVGLKAPGAPNYFVQKLSNTIIMKPLQILTADVNENSMLPLRALKILMSSPDLSVGERIAKEFGACDTTLRRMAAGRVALDLARLISVTYKVIEIHERNTQHVRYFQVLVPALHEFAKTYEGFIEKYPQNHQVLLWGSTIVKKLMPLLEMAKTRVPYLPMLNPLTAIDTIIGLLKNGLPTNRSGIPMSRCSR